MGILMIVCSNCKKKKKKKKKKKRVIAIPFFFFFSKSSFPRLILKGKFSSGTEFSIIFKPLGNCMIFKIKYNFVILELIGQPYLI